MQIYPGEQEPYLYAHRGCSKAAPENTLTAFDEALKRGIPGVELDIHLCASGELVVTHDDNLKRVTGLDALVEETDFSKIRELDAGSWKDERFRGERIPLLEDVFDLLGRKVYYDIEIKCRKRDITGLELKLIKLINKYSLEQRCVISSFNPIPIRTFKRLNPNIPTAIIYCSDTGLPWYLRRGQGRWIASADILKPEHTTINRASMFFNHIIGKMPVIPWTVDDAETASRLISLGVQGIISNVPDETGLMADRI